MKNRQTKNLILITDEDKFDFILIGLICEKKDYRISLEINRKLEINLRKEEDYIIFNNKRMEDVSFPFFEYQTEDEDRFNLISNKNQKKFLLPELNQIDYLFIARIIRMPLNESDLVAALKEIPIVLGAYKLDPSRLKSKDNLIF